MSSLRTGVVGFEPNPQIGEAYLDAVGRLIVNFGGIELLSHVWVAEMARDDLLIDLAAELSFDRRIDLVLELLERERMPQNWKRRSRELWMDVRQLAEIRNVVACSPIAFAWKGRPTAGPPDIIGTPNLKYLKKKKSGRQLPMTPISGLRQAINSLALVAQSLSRHLDEFRVRSRKKKRSLSRRAA